MGTDYLAAVAVGEVGWSRPSWCLFYRLAFVSLSLEVVIRVLIASFASLAHSVVGLDALVRDFWSGFRVRIVNLGCLVSQPAVASSFDPSEPVRLY